MSEQNDRGQAAGGASAKRFRGVATLPWGVAMLAAGLVGTMVRYGAYPLELGLSSTVRAMIVGSLAAFVVLGVQTIRRAWRAGERIRPVREAMVFLLTTALVGALGLHLAPRGGGSAMVAGISEGSPAEVELERYELPGLVVSLPPWAATSVRLEARDGVVELADPGGLDRSMKLTWKYGDPPPQGTLVDMFTQGRAGLKFEGSTRLQVSGVSTERLYFREVRAGKRVAVTQWRCPDDRRFFTLTSFLNLKREALLRLHDRVLAGVRCAKPPSVARLKPSFPRLPDAVMASSDDSAVVYLSGGVSYLFTAGTSEAQAVEAFQAEPHIRRKIVSVLGMAPAADAFDGLPRRLGEPPRMIYAGDVHDRERGESYRVLETMFACEGQAYVGLAIPESDGLPHDAAERLASAVCPQRAL